MVIKMPEMIRKVFCNSYNNTKKKIKYEITKKKIDIFNILNEYIVRKQNSKKYINAE